MITLGKRGETLIKHRETVNQSGIPSLVAYLPTPDDVWTIGFGSIRGVKRGMIITPAIAQTRFENDTAEAVSAVDLIYRKMGAGSHSLTQSMIDALISLVYNEGPAPLFSTNTIGAALIAKKYYEAWQGFALWRTQNHKDLLGLARRRGEEMMLFLEDGIPS